MVVSLDQMFFDPIISHVKMGISRDSSWSSGLYTNTMSVVWDSFGALQCCAFMLAWYDGHVDELLYSWRVLWNLCIMP